MHMKILYLTEDYLYSKVHNNLLCALLRADSSLMIYVFSPVRHNNAHGIEDSFERNDRLIVLTPIIDIPVWRYRVDFWAKQKCKVRLIERFVPIKEIDAVHAATLYSDGGAARRLQKKYGIPFLATVRGADMMFYTQKMPHLWHVGNNVIRYANALVCVTPSIKKRLLNSWQYAGVKDVLQNADVVNNGIDKLWLEHLNTSSITKEVPSKVLYIGRFDKNKNVLRLIKAILLLRDRHDIKLTLIGGKGEEHEDVLKIVSSNPGILDYLGPIYDKEKLMCIVREHDIFAMVSHSETFGLVYAECLSQGLPILYSSGTGFDGMYEDGVVGYSVNSYSIDSIASGLEMIMNNYQRLRDNVSLLDFSHFSWDYATTRYLNYYESIYLQKDDEQRYTIRNAIKDLYYYFMHLIHKPYDLIRRNKVNRTNRLASGVIVKYSQFGSYNYIAGGTALFNVIMGSYCSIGPDCLFGGMEHDYTWYSTSARIREPKNCVPETVIGNDVWIGAKCIIKAGVKIGDGAVIGAHSLVTKDVEPYSITYGSPAKHVRYRFDKDVCKTIQESEFWKLSPNQARKKLYNLNLIR